MTQEDLIKKLSTPYFGTSGELGLEWIKPDENGFSRNLKVTTSYGYSFEILWYKNLLTICLDNNIKIWADDIFLSSTMPHHTKLDIRTTFNGVDSGFCIPAIYYNNIVPV